MASKAAHWPNRWRLKPRLLSVPPVNRPVQAETNAGLDPVRVGGLPGPQALRRGFNRQLTIGLERLALATVMLTVLLLGYWYPITLVMFPQSWLNNQQYALITSFNPQFQMITLYPSDISALLTIFLWLFARLTAVITRQPRTHLRFGPAVLTLPLVGLIILSALSATQAIFPSLSLEIALRLLLIAGFVLTLLNLRPPAWVVVLPLALLLAIEGLLSIVQVSAQSTLWGAYLFNWTQDATPGESGASVVQLPGGALWLRGYGSFPHPNILGGFLCLALPLVAGAYLRLPRRSKTAWLMLAALALGITAFLLSFSRAAWLGLLIGTFWAGLLIWRQKRVATKTAPERLSLTEPRFSGWKKSLLRPALLALLATGLFVGVILTLGPVFQSRLLLATPLEHTSVSERIVLMEAGVVFISQHPWLGVGAGNMPLVELAYQPTSGIGAPVHNVPLLLGVETGIFGLLLWLIPPLALLLGLWRRKWALPPLAIAVSAAFVALLVVAQLDHYLWDQPTGNLLYWLAAALLALWSDPLTKKTLAQ